MVEADGPVNVADEHVNVCIVSLFRELEHLVEAVCVCEQR